MSAAFATIYPVPLLAKAPEGLISYAGAIDKPLISASGRPRPAATPAVLACGMLVPSLGFK